MHGFFSIHQQFQLLVKERKRNMTMASSSKAKSQYHIRSTSLPCRSHPSTARIEEELNKLKIWEASSSSAPTAKTISHGLSEMEGLYKCMEDLFNLPMTQKALSHHQLERCVDDLQDRFMSLLDVCGTLRDVMSQIKEHGRDTQSSLRRRKGDPDVESSITEYTCFRKKMKKEANKLIVSKQMDSKIWASPVLEQDDDHHVSSIIRALREVLAVSFFVLHSILFFLSVPISKPKSGKKSMISKLLQKGTVISCEEKPENVNEFQRLDVALHALCRSDLSEGDKMKTIQNSLKTLEVSIEAIENGLECLFRGLIKSRSSLLNIVSA